MVREVESFPYEAEFPSHVTATFLRYGGANAQFLLFARRLYEVRNAAGEIILVAGVTTWSLARRPELWIMLAKPFLQNRRESLRLTREALRLPASQFPNLVVEADRRKPADVSFLRHFGWRETGRRSLRANAPEEFIQFEVA